MAIYTIKRILQGLLVIFIVSIITFLVLKVIPSDPAALILGTDATPESLAALRESMGLNDPLIFQYGEWIVNTLKGDLGRSYYFGQEVSQLIGERLPVTITLAIISTVVSFIIALILGIIAAINKFTWVDYLIRLTTQITAAMPTFWVGMIALTYLAARWGWFPVAGRFDLGADFWGSIRSIILPSLVLAISQVGSLIRQVRTAMMNALSSEYMIATNVKGLSRFRAIFVYALRSAIMTPVTVAALQFAGLFGGTAVIETVFSLAGLGRLLVVSVEQRDMVLLQGIILFITSVVIMISVLTDIFYALVNKTIKLEGNA
ncbi:ABC transporter permease [Fundicoccus culcitae]|uniref:ABC transporter permease n=1 Tax=Fundicoccus culcitae TaxID=2969821 RepID=A0ABY5P4E7_9LACT|nr:ABC transporter permease [Fundicoccus culcitae]UUX33602.1 ABC transporter permease [Fundicoccus culcitae]